MGISLCFRRAWMLAGFAAAFLVGDMFLAVRGASARSVEFLYGVAGFSLAQLFWTLGQMREARPDWRVSIAAAIPLSALVLCRLALSPAATTAVLVYSILTSVSFATALVTRRVFYVCGIGLLMFSDLMIGLGLARMPGCGVLVGPTYVVAELCLIASFLWRGEWRIPRGRCNVWRASLVGGVVAFACFAVAAFSYPGGGYNPFRQMLSALGMVKVRGVVYPSCHAWFMAGLLLAAASVAAVWGRQVGASSGWRRVASGWGGALNVAGLCMIALVPFDVNGDVHDFACNLAVLGGFGALVARLRRGGDLAWTCYLAALIAFFVVCLSVEALTFDPWVTSTQKVLIVSFATWVGWVAWRLESSRGCRRTAGSVEKVV